jgi:hypothetical protein
VTKTEKNISHGLIVVARSPAEDGGTAAFEAALVAALAGAGRTVIVVPHLYYLQRGMEGAERLAATTGPLVVASWLKPRAARWVLAALGREADGVTAVDLHEFGTGEEAAKKILAALGETTAKEEEHTLAPAKPGLQSVAPGLGRRWYPVIDYSRCVGCKQCHDFCLFGVYAVDASGRVSVTQPDNCKPGCPACARVCPVSAIIFPECKDDEAIAGGEGKVKRDSKNMAANSGRHGTHAEKEKPNDDLDDLLDSLDALDKS